MAASQQNISDSTPMGANLIAGGATFRVWAPNALKVYVVLDFSAAVVAKPATEDTLLVKNENGHWTGFVPGVTKEQQYLFYVVGTNPISGPKRDPYARALTDTDFPWKCIIGDATFPWHDQAFVTPAFSDFVIYQLHVGVYNPPSPPEDGTFLDVAAKIPYLSALGITAVQLLPIQEFETQFSMGYNGVDFFSPEMRFAVDDDKLQPYLDAVNGLLTAKDLAPYTFEDLRGAPNQLRALVDLFHCYGMAVIFDVVYNHAGGGFDDQSIYFFDRRLDTLDNNNSLYFTSVGFVGGLVFDYSKPDVRAFLIDNAKFFIEEYHVDGFRYDEVSTIDHLGQPDGWSFCQDLTSTTKFIKPQAINHAEYWAVNPLVVEDAPVGAGFNTTLADALRNAIRDVIGNASQPDERPLNMNGLAASLWQGGLNREWQFVQGPENHDLVYYKADGAIRIARLSDPSNPRSWFGRSRSRVAMGICLTAPGIPMLFMGQEFLEDKLWADDLVNAQNLLLNWQGLTIGDKQMTDFLLYTTDLIHLRWQYPALRGQGFAVVHADNNNRVCAFHRWVEGEGNDILVVISLANNNQFGYRIGFPWGGTWKEAFNSDVYEDWVNPNVAGNGGQVTTDDQPFDG
ncbi:MAG TPA: alpha amylase C-terminal domain-containing protein, partial [Mucilaginibacter sp.]|nr:alpha amylase C-terminal domain-containing protein [Mucilaginibacter sp.]